MRVKKKYKVIIKTSLEDAPKPHELSAAIILAYHFESDVIFIRPEHARTPDIDVDGVRWEIKSPLGDGRRTISNNFREARGQSENIVIDLRRTKMHENKANARIRFYLSKPHHFRRVIIITRSKKVVAVF